MSKAPEYDCPDCGKVHEYGKHTSTSRQPSEDVNNLMDNFIRDITKVHPMSKSEARRRLAAHDRAQTVPPQPSTPKGGDKLSLPLPSEDTAKQQPYKCEWCGSTAKTHLCAGNSHKLVVNHRQNHIVPNDNTDGAMTSAKSSKPSEDINYREYGEVRKYKLVDGIFLEAQIIVPGRLRWFGDMHKTMKAAKAELEAKLASLDNHIVPSEDIEGLREIVFNLADQIGTIVTKYHHKEIDFDDTNTLSVQYQKQAIALIADHDRNLLAGIEENIKAEAYTLLELADGEGNRESVDGLPLTDILAIVKAATPGKEME